jgi:4-amino-4-deoxy-L-arabinose transferase-like glycosyltransferase
MISREVEPVVVAGSTPRAVRRGASLASALDNGALMLGFIGVTSSLLYLNLTVQMSLLEFFPGERRITVDFPKMLGPDWLANTVLVGGTFATLFWLYLLALFWVRRLDRRTGGWIVFGFAAAFVVILTFMYPPTAVDFIHNVSDARTLWVFGDNAMTVPPLANPFPVAQSFDEEPAPYGPLWFLLLFPVKFGGDNLQAQLHILKFSTSLWYLGSAILVYLIVRRWRPGREVFATALYAWNPFVVMKLAGNGHNDATLMFFVLLAVWLHVAGRRRWVLPALVASALVKYVTLMIIPPFLLAGLLAAPDRRRYLRDTAIGAGISVALIVAAFAYFWEGSDTFATLRDQANRFYSSTPGAIMRALVRRGAASEDAASTARAAGTGAFAVVYIGLLVAFVRRRRTDAEMVAWGALIFVGYLALAVTWFRPWYLIWPYTLVVLLYGRWPAVLFLAGSFFAMFVEMIEVYRTNVDFLLGHFHLSDALPAITSFVPPVTIVVTCWLFAQRAFLVEGEPGGGALAAEPILASDGEVRDDR